jgi:ABC-2 type transport system ATP-binding protein
MCSTYILRGVLSRSHANTDAAAILTEGLTKRFGATVALDGLNLRIPRGRIFAVLGPNGAGKTTAVRICCTLLSADSGRAVVDGHDVAREPRRVREAISLTGQFAAVDERLTGRENLVLLARLQGLRAREARRRAGELLERFALSPAASRLAGTYSGGMRRRLDLAATLAVPRPIVVLDEPTTGLDPASRFRLWAAIGDLSRAGTTIVLTTQYLEEADQLADIIAVIDKGKVIVSGAPSQIKARAGGQRLEVALHDATDTERAKTALEALTTGRARAEVHERRATVPVSGDALELLTRAATALRAQGLAVDDLTLRQPTLDEAFLTLTGHTAEVSPAAPPGHLSAAPDGRRA